MPEIESYATLSRKRASMKQRVNYFCQYVDNLTTATKADGYKFTELKHIELQQKIEVISTMKREYEVVQLDLETIVEDDQLETQYDYRNEFETKYDSCMAKARVLNNLFITQLGLKVDDEKSATGSGSPSRENSTESHHSIRSSADFVNNPKLPAIDIPHFSGDYNQWLEFRDTFDSLIHQHTSLPNILKYHYLRSSLKGEAKQVIKSLDFSQNNYEKAWKLVCDRYNNSRLLINNHIKALFNVEPIREESSKKLRSFMDNIEKHLCALETLNQPTDKWDVLIIHMASLKLDRETNRKWEEHQSGSHSPTLEEFKEFLNHRADFLESLELKQDTKNSTRSLAKSKKIYSNTSITNSQACVICQEEHAIFNCPQFQSFTVKDRYDRIKSLRLCLNCLRPNHFLSKCKSKGTCRFCKAKHNTLLHNPVNRKDTGSSENAGTTDNASENDKVCLSTRSSSTTALLGTVCLIVFDKENNSHQIRAVLDCGSQSSYLTKRVCELLQLEVHPVNMNIVGLGMKCSKVGKQCTVKIQAIQNAFSIEISCLVIPDITGPLPETTFDYSKLEIPSHIRLADPSFNQSKTIDMLIGVDHFWELLCAAQIKLKKNGPFLQKTKLGWVVSGPVDIASNISKRTRCNLARNIDEQISRFWTIEEDLSRKTAWSKDEQTCESFFQNTTTRDETGRFVVSIPFKQNLSLLGDSRDRATRLFYSLERRLENNVDLKNQYCDFMQEYQDLGHMTEVCMNDNGKPTYYMPHHGVLREERETTKLRVVFNASSPTTTGYSLNDLQLVGPTIQEDLLSILLRFRQHTYVASADIKQMYRQVLVKIEHRPLQRILWRSNPSVRISEFNLNTVTYGMSSAPFLAIRCLFSLADENETRFPNASKIIKRDFYVDDLLTGADSVRELQQLCKEISLILGSAHFELRKWISNEQLVLNTIDKSRWSLHSTNMLEDGDAKTLGVGWNSKMDSLVYKVNIEKSTHCRITKRSILSDTARIFDPLGLLAPVIVVAKILLQRLWQLKVSWDEAIPLALHTEWRSFIAELHTLNEIQIPRHVLAPGTVRIELHGFADASERAYGACIYMRSFQKDGSITVKLLCAKSRVSPLKSITLPRLELCGALILARLFNKVKTSLNLNLVNCVFWSDSSIVLGWLNTEPNKLKTFVSNRVAEIQTITEPYEWHHVPTHDNPADLVSRGVSPSMLKELHLWWSGPSWLSTDPIPCESRKTLEQIELPDVKIEKHCLCSSTNTENNFELFSRVSNLNRLERILAWCIRWRFIRSNRFVGPISWSEVQEARKRIVILVQGESFASEILDLKTNGCVSSKSKIFRLSPFIHSDGTLRVGGRLQNCNYVFNKTHPMILPANHKFTELLFLREHKALLHCGPQHLLSSIREKFWPLGGRNLARKIVHNCLTCAKLSAMPFNPVMGNLPQPRATPAPPFYKTGVDYAGPFTVTDKRGRGHKTTKAYMCLFICLCTKSIHLELVSNLTTDNFLMSLRRFVSRRGKPHDIYSDNATNFVGANNELRELADMLVKDRDSLLQSMTSEGINWHFIPPRSPHFGGIWEAAVKSVKHHLKRIAGNARLTFEEMHTLLIQIEAIVNSRPLYPLSPDPNDFTPLTPGHFLIGRPLTALPDVNLMEENENRLAHYQRVQQLKQHFWKRWSREYLSQLQVRSKWVKSSSEPKVGDLVVVKDDNLPPLVWKMGRICQLHPGADGQARVVSVRTSTGIIKRAITKVCPLPIATA